MNGLTKWARVATASVLGASAMFSAHGAEVRVWGERFSLSTISDFYDGLTGHNSEIIAGPLTAASLAGVGLLWAVQPSDAYTPAELGVMSGFLALGGRIAFLGEHGGFAPAENLRINDALSSFGAGIAIVNNALSCGLRTAERAAGEIATHPLTTGVDDYRYGCFAELTLSGSAVSLMTGDTGSDGAGISMMAFQNIGAGSVFLITDQNVWDNAPNWTGFDNARMFENLLVADTGAPPPGVPEPGTLALLGLGLAAVSLRRKAKAAKV